MYGLTLESQDSLGLVNVTILSTGEFISMLYLIFNTCPLTVKAIQKELSNYDRENKLIVEIFTDVSLTLTYLPQNKKDLGAEMLYDTMQATIPPELRNRLDMICKFNKLDNLAVKKIVVKFIEELKVGLRDKDITIGTSEGLVDHLVEVGYDPKMGARPLNRKIDQLIRVPLSKKILFDGMHSCELVLDWKDGELDIKQTGQKQLAAPQPKVNDEGFIVLDQFKPKK